MKRDENALYKYLKKHHTGGANAVICKQLQLTFRLPESAIRRYVSTLRKEGVPICSSHFGYFYPETRSEVVDTVMRFDRYRMTLSATSDHLLYAAARI